MGDVNKNLRPRAGVIGVGAMGRNHARVYSEMDEVELVAVADQEQDCLSRIAARINVNTYLDYQEMISRESLDMVSVAVPSSFHYQVARNLIQQGLNILIEKPLSSSIEEGQELIELAEEKGIILGVGHVERFNPVIREIKTRLEDGMLGRVFQITVRRTGPFPERIKDVGVLLDLATHDIDLMYYLTGAEVQNVWTEAARVLHSRHEDLAVSTLRFNNGVIGVLIENWLSPAKVRDVTINGERGMLVADLLTQDLHFYANNYTVSNWESLGVFRGMTEGDMTRFHMVRTEPLRLELEAFARAVARQEPFPVSGEDGLRAIVMAQRLINSAGRNQS